MKLITIPCILAFMLLNFNLLGKNKMEWHYGLIKLISGIQLKGDINFNPELDIVSLLKDGNIKSFTPNKVESFEFYDEEIEENRIFISLNYVQTSFYSSKIFFELLLPGKVSLVRRYNTFNQFYSLKADALADNFGSYNYYAYANGTFTNLKRFKKQLLPLFRKEFEEEMIDFVGSNNLRLKRIEHQIVIIDYYNFLSDPQRKVLNPDYLISLNN